MRLTFVQRQLDARAVQMRELNKKLESMELWIKRVQRDLLELDVSSGQFAAEIQQQPLPKFSDRLVFLFWPLPIIFGSTAILFYSMKYAPAVNNYRDTIKRTLSYIYKDMAEVNVELARMQESYDQLYAFIRDIKATSTLAEVIERLYSLQHEISLSGGAVDDSNQLLMEMEILIVKGRELIPEFITKTQSWLDTALRAEILKRKRDLADLSDEMTRHNQNAALISLFKKYRRFLQDLIYELELEQSQKERGHHPLSWEDRLESKRASLRNRVEAKKFFDQLKQEFPPEYHQDIDRELRKIIEELREEVMKSVLIGLDANGKPLLVTPQMRRSTHMHVIGGSGTGKSKFLEWLIRKDIREGHGLCLIDWHGTLYQDVLRYCAHLDIGLYNDFRSLILLNPSRPDFVTGFNPFMNQGNDIATQVANRIAATIRPWGITDTNLMPTFERICRLLYTFAVEQQQTLPNAAQLLQFDKPALREYAIEVVSDPYIKEQWRQLHNIKTFRDWKEFVLSTENRLGRFLASKTIKRFFGLAENNINLRDIMDKQQILLINLGSSGYLDRESARTFASLLLNEFFETAMIRGNEAKAKDEEPKAFVLYLDEFQEYITNDLTAMLDQVRKGGLHLALAHQHLGHLADNPKLRKSIFTNARIRAVFGGLDYEDASVLANEMFLPDLNTRQIKKAYYHTTHIYREETRTIRSHTTGHSDSSGESWSSGSGSSSMSGAGQASATSKSLPGSDMTIFTPFTEGWFGESESTNRFSSSGSSAFEGSGGSSANTWSESEGETVVPVWVPIPIQELGSEAEWNREEKVSKVAEMLKCQQQRHCYIKLDTDKTQPLKIPFVKDYSHSQEYLLEYEQAVYEAQGALSADQADQLIVENEQKFLTTAQEALDLNSAIEIEAREVTEEAEQPKKPTSQTKPHTKPTKPNKKTPFDKLLNNPTDE